MPAVDLYTKPGQAGIDLALQRALLVTWIFINANKAWIDPNTVLVKDDAELEKVKKDGAANKSDIQYLDMRDVYPHLAPMQPADIDAMIAGARTSPTHQAIAAEFWDDGEDCCSYVADYCLAMREVLKLNKA